MFEASKRRPTGSGFCKERIATDEDAPILSEREQSRQVSSDTGTQAVNATCAPDLNIAHHVVQPSGYWHVFPLDQIAWPPW